MAKKQNPAQGSSAQAKTVSIELETFDRGYIHLSCARALLKVIEINAECDNAIELSDHLIAESLHGIGLMLEAADEFLGDTK